MRAGLLMVTMIFALVAIIGGMPIRERCGEVANPSIGAECRERIDSVMEDRNEDPEGVEELWRRSFFSKLKHAVSHVAHAVTHPVAAVVQHVAHTVAHPVQAIKRVAHAVTHPISTVKHVAAAIHHTVSHVVHSVKHIATSIHHTVEHAVHSVKHIATTIHHAVRSAAHFIKTNGPTIAKIGLKMLASSQGILATASKFVPGLGIPMSKALKMEAKGLDMASGAIHAKVPKGWQTAMNVMSIAEDPVGAGLKRAGLHGAVGAAAEMILG